MNSASLKSIWKNKKDKIKLKMIFLDYDQGGLRVPSIYVLLKSLKLAWISKIRGRKLYITVQLWQEISRSDWDTSVLQTDSPVFLGIKRIFS